MHGDQLPDDFLSQFRQTPDSVFAQRLYRDLARQRRPWWHAGGVLARLLLSGAATMAALLLAWTMALSVPPAAAPPRTVARAPELSLQGQPAWAPAPVVLRVNASPLAHHHS